jgi:hypothetical protein
LLSAFAYQWYGFVFGVELWCDHTIIVQSLLMLKSGLLPYLDFYPPHSPVHLILPWVFSLVGGITSKSLLLCQIFANTVILATGFIIVLKIFKNSLWASLFLIGFIGILQINVLSKMVMPYYNSDWIFWLFLSFLTLLLLSTRRQSFFFKSTFLVLAALCLLSNPLQAAPFVLASIFFSVFYLNIFTIRDGLFFFLAVGAVYLFIKNLTGLPNLTILTNRPDGLYNYLKPIALINLELPYLFIKKFFMVIPLIVLNERFNILSKAVFLGVFYLSFYISFYTHFPGINSAIIFSILTIGFYCIQNIHIGLLSLFLLLFVNFNSGNRSQMVTYFSHMKSRNYFSINHYRTKYENQYVERELMPGYSLLVNNRDTNYINQILMNKRMQGKNFMHLGGTIVPLETAIPNYKRSKLPPWFAWGETVDSSTFLRLDRIILNKPKCTLQIDYYGSYGSDWLSSNDFAPMYIDHLRSKPKLNVVQKDTMSWDANGLNVKSVFYEIKKQE